MKLPTDPRLPATLPVELTKLLRDITWQVNGITEGQMHASHAARTSVPTTGDWAVGDFVKNKKPAEAGTAGSKYIVIGWVCTVSGSPGTWLPCRVLTGN